jgi:glycosyltransferase involved in cell wall biosynthesis
MKVDGASFMRLQAPDKNAESRLPLVSIITPCFNSMRFIKDCIESVLTQTYSRVEHIVQDGASADGTVEVLRRYAGRIDWVSEPDHGQADALDKALKRSHGEILLVLNADDILLPHAASWAVKAMAKYPTDAVIYGDEYLMDELGHTIGEYVAPEYDFASVLCVERVLPAQAAFIRRSSLEQVGLGADATLDSCPDYEMFVRLGLRFSMRHVPGFVARYRYYARPMDGVMPRSVDRFIQAKTRVMERVFDNCTDNNNEIKSLRRRAKGGLYLWASEEARGIGDSRSALKYYAEALSQFGILGRALAVPIRFYSKSVAERAVRERHRHAPSLSRALAVGTGLFAARVPLVRSARRLIRTAPPAFQILVSVVLSVLITYLLFSWKSGR